MPLWGGDEHDSGGGRRGCCEDLPSRKGIASGPQPQLHLWRCNYLRGVRNQTDVPQSEVPVELIWANFLSSPQDSRTQPQENCRPRSRKGARRGRDAGRDQQP